MTNKKITNLPRHRIDTMSTDEWAELPPTSNDKLKKFIEGAQDMTQSTPPKNEDSESDILKMFREAAAKSDFISPELFAQYCFAANKSIKEAMNELASLSAEPYIVGFNPIEALTQWRKTVLEQEIIKLPPNDRTLYGFLGEYNDILDGFWFSPLLDCGDFAPAGLSKPKKPEDMTALELLQHGERLAEWGVASHTILIATMLLHEDTENVYFCQDDRFIIIGYKGTTHQMTVSKSWLTKHGQDTFSPLPRGEATAGKFRSRRNSDTIKEYFPISDKALETMYPIATQFFLESVFIYELLDFGYLLPSNKVALPPYYLLHTLFWVKGEANLLTPTSFPLAYITTNGEVHAVHHTAYDALTIQKGLSAADGKRYFTKAVTVEWYYSNVSQFVPIENDGYEKIGYINHLGEKKIIDSKDIKFSLHHINYPDIL